ncbi:MAG: hypothetical protein WC608_00950 [Parcubacteria group bacterium]
MTTLTLEQLREMAGGASARLCGGFAEERYTGSLPIGAVMNEIGTIFVNGDKSAESDLVALFDSPDSRVAGVAYFYLSQKRSEVRPETLAKIEAFESDPANAATVARAKKKIEQFTSKAI